MVRYATRAMTLAFVLTLPALAAEQGLLQQPTPVPTVTAESEPWFVSRAPILFGGTWYFPAGAQMHFNQNEMVRTGWLGAVPVYIRTTLEPRSVIFVPLSGGLVQPYERRRSGELAGTEGSVPPAFPVENPAESTGSEPRALRAAGPPIGAAVTIGGDVSPFTPSIAQPPPARAVGTVGTTPFVPTHPLESALRPEGLNAVFVNFENQRWFHSGQAVPFEASAFRQIGTYKGFAVYSHSSHPGTIFIPVAKDASALAPYSNLRRR
jgi:hypothetical protein